MKDDLSSNVNFGKILLHISHGYLKDFNMEHKVQEILKLSGLPPDINEIPSEIRSDENPPAYITPMPQPPNVIFNNLDELDDWLYSDTGFIKYLKEG